MGGEQRRAIIGGFFDADGFLDFAVTNRRYITSELAVEDGTWEITGLPEMEPAPPSSGLYTVYLIKQDGQWAVTAGRTRIPVAAPPE